MLDTIILLTGPVDESVLASVLRRHNEQADIRLVKTLEELEAIGPEVLARARLVAFVTPVIVPARVLGALGYGGYNFHPGPPHYPGFIPSYLALYDRATKYGATAHLMVEKVDAGPIIGCKLFDVPEGATLVDLERLAFIELARMFWELAGPLTTRPEPLPVLPIQWSGRKATRRLYESMCQVGPDTPKEELDRLTAVFGGGHFGLLPTVKLHGHTFRLEQTNTPELAATA